MTDNLDPPPPLRIPLAEERMRIDKKRIETGRVTVRSKVVHEDAAIRETLASNSLRVERISIDRFVDRPPMTRSEGNCTIVPVFEEILVKRIHLIEEVHITCETNTSILEDEVSLRRMDVSVERSGASSE